jgi:hypothetical protein
MQPAPRAGVWGGESMKGVPNRRGQHEDTVQGGDEQETVAETDGYCVQIADAVAGVVDRTGRVIDRRAGLGPGLGMDVDGQRALA